LPPIFKYGQGGSTKNPGGATINHFYEKIAALKDKMKHQILARKLAEKRQSNICWNYFGAILTRMNGKC